MVRSTDLPCAQDLGVEQRALLDRVLAVEDRADRRPACRSWPMSVMKPRRPWLTPTSGTWWRTSSRAAASMVPSPPITIARSALVSPSGRTSQPRLRRNARSSLQRRFDLRAAQLADQRDRVGKPRTCARVYNEFHARQARPDPAQDADRALHRRGPADRLAHAVQVLRPRPLARHDPQRDGRPRGARLHRQPAHLRRPRARRRAATASSSTRCWWSSRCESQRAARSSRASCTPTTRSA